VVELEVYAVFQFQEREEWQNAELTRKHSLEVAPTTISTF